MNTCPCCGYCPHCGRSNRPVSPQPPTPIYPQVFPGPLNPRGPFWMKGESINVKNDGHETISMNDMAGTAYIAPSFRGWKAMHVVDYGGMPQC